MLEVKNLTKHYRNICSVKDLNFSVGENEIVGLLGPNGAGKSTTMKMITGYLAPTEGTVSVDGIDVFQDPINARKHIGYLPEIPPLYSEMTVKEYLKFICDLRHIENKEIEEEILRVCDALNITHIKERIIKNLSKGYKQRVGFAGAIIGKPKLLILDEPTVGLDPSQMIDLRLLIKELSSMMSIIISSHILTEISSICTRILIINQGELLANGTLKEIENAYSKAFKTKVLVRGDKNKTEKLISSVITDKDIIEYSKGINDNEHSFSITTDINNDPRAKIFEIFADNKNEVSLLEMGTLNMTLEEIFIDITNKKIGDTNV